jgi:hypothetical protein
MLTGRWKKSTRSNGSGGNNCVEARWKTAAASGSGTCVEVRITPAPKDEP